MNSARRNQQVTDLTDIKPLIEVPDIPSTIFNKKPHHYKKINVNGYTINVHVVTEAAIGGGGGGGGGGAA